MATPQVPYIRENSDFTVYNHVSAHAKIFGLRDLILERYRILFKRRSLTKYSLHWMIFIKKVISP